MIPEITQEVRHENVEKEENQIQESRPKKPKYLEDYHLYVTTYKL